MFKTTSDLQEFILWCRQAKIKAVKVGDMEVQFSDIAFIDDITQAEISAETVKQVIADSAMQQESDSKAEAAEDEELLFWSTGGGSIIPPQS